MFKNASQRTAVVLAEQERHGQRKPRAASGAMASMLGQHFSTGRQTNLRSPFGRGQSKTFAGGSAMYPKPKAPWSGGTQQIYKPQSFKETETKPMGSHGGNASRTGDVYGQDTMAQGLKGTTFKGY